MGLPGCGPLFGIKLPEIVVVVGILNLGPARHYRKSITEPTVKRKMASGLMKDCILPRRCQNAFHAILSFSSWT